MTDFFGYKKTSGGSIQDQIGQMLTSKEPMLNSAGRVMVNRFYYDENSSSVDPVESLDLFAKDRTAFNQSKMGTTPSVHLPQTIFAGLGYIVYQLPELQWDGTATAADYFYAPHGWAFFAAEQYILYLGAASISNIEWDSRTNFYACLAQCESDSKRQQMINGAGRFLLNRATVAQLARSNKEIGISNMGLKNAVAGQKVFLAGLANANVRAAYGGVVPNVTYEPFRYGYCPVKLPWSSMISRDPRIDLDTTLLNQPIQLSIKLRKKEELFFCSNVNTFNTLKEYSQITYQMWTQELANKALSLKSSIQANPSMNITVPFQLMQYLPISTRATNTSRLAGTSPKFLVNLSSLINADLTQMTFAVVWEGDEMPNTISYTVPAGGGVLAPYTNTWQSWCPALGRKCNNIQLTLNRQRIFEFESSIYDSAILTKHETAQRCRVVKVVAPAADAANDNNRRVLGHLAHDSNFSVDTFETNYYELSMCHVRPLIVESHFQNTARYTNMTFQLEFEVDNFEGWFNEPDVSGENTVKNNFTVYMMYYYNAVLLIGSHGGTVTLLTA